MMKGKVFSSSLLILVTMFCSGCGKSTYLLEESIEDIVRIEIVSAQSSVEYSVVKTLTDEEAAEYLEIFLDISFRNYYLGDPMYVHGTGQPPIMYTREELEYPDSSRQQ